MSHEALFNLARTRYSKITTPTIARAHLHVSGYMMCVCVCVMCVCVVSVSTRLTVKN
jgi:hypothetical protein